jgi:hypothetical protein
MSKIIVRVKTTKLTDGSKVYAVEISRNEAESIRFDALDESMAQALVESIASAIELNTNESVLEVDARYDAI